MLKNFFKGFLKGQKLFGETISTIINSILLTIVYVFGVGISSLFGKISKKDFLDLNPSSKKTYWSELNLTKQSIEKYYRQF